MLLLQYFQHDEELCEADPSLCAILSNIPPCISLSTHATALPPNVTTLGKIPLSMHL